MGDPTKDPKLQWLLDSVNQALLTAGWALRQPYPLPALVLTYTLIDTFGWVSREREDEGVRDSFVRFADEWILARGRLGCTALDLYAARCAVLHRMTGDSDLSQSGKARRVLYCYGAGDLSPLAAVTTERTTEEFACVSIDCLIQAVRWGIAEYITQTNGDAARRARLLERAQAYYGHFDVNFDMVFSHGPEEG